MNMDYILVSGLLLVVFSLPALLAAWADGRAFFPRVGVLVLGLAMVEWCYFSDSETYAVSNWPEAGMRVAAAIIP